MNELQKVEFDLFLCFDKICKELNLDYFLLCGSALGAVRHGGFIPWDDDFDVGMYREDYNKFMELAPEMLPEGIFLQNYKTDCKYPLVYAKMRNSGTTFVESPIAKFDMNHGIYMDIFPLDGYPDKASEQRKLNLCKAIYRQMLYCGFDMPRRLKSLMVAALLRMLGYQNRTVNTLEKYEALISKYPVVGSKIICSHGNRYGTRDYIPAEYYGDGRYVSFEGMTVRIPEKYDEYLTRLYGDWKTLPPPEEQKGVHKYKYCDTEKPYTDYV